MFTSWSLVRQDAMPTKEADKTAMGLTAKRL